MDFVGIVVAGFLAGLINTLAGGGPILTLLALTLAGVDPRTANLTSTVALIPGQILTGRAGGRRTANDSPVLPLSILCLTALGGAIGASLLIVTSAQWFGLLVPWLVLFATIAYIVSPSPESLQGSGRQQYVLPLPVWWLLPILGIYGGFYGGGNSFLLLALLGWSGFQRKSANNSKNLLVAAINAAGAAVFILSGEVAWRFALALCVGNLGGSFAGLHVFERISARWLRWIVVGAGLALAVMLFWRAYGR